MLFLGSLVDHHQSITGSLHCPGTTPWQLDAASTLDASFFPVFPPSKDFYTLVLLGFLDCTSRHGQDFSILSNVCSFERSWCIGTTSTLLSFQLVFYCCLLLSESFRIISSRPGTWHGETNNTDERPSQCRETWTENDSTSQGQIQGYSGKKGLACKTSKGVLRKAQQRHSERNKASSGFSHLSQEVLRCRCCPLGQQLQQCLRVSHKPFRLALLWLSGHAAAVCSFDFAYLIIMVKYHDETNSTCVLTMGAALDSALRDLGLGHRVPKEAVACGIWGAGRWRKESGCILHRLEVFKLLCCCEFGKYCNNWIVWCLSATRCREIMPRRGMPWAMKTNSS